MEAERNRVQGNRVLSLWKVRTRTGQRHGCLVKHIASQWDANKHFHISKMSYYITNHPFTGCFHKINIIHILVQWALL